MYSRPGMEQHLTAVKKPADTVEKTLALSLWMQWTFAKVAAKLYGDFGDGTGKSLVGSLSQDAHTFLSCVFIILLIFF